MAAKNNPNKNVQPFVLVILDGWGVAAKSTGNAISLARTPMMDYFYKHYPNTILKASGPSVGLPPKQSGNSEAGHMNIGAGRIVKQDIQEILDQIKSGKFFQNPALIEVSYYLQEHKSANVHIVGLLTGYQSSHSYPEHLYALLDFFKLKKISPVYLHLFSDGRDAGKYEGVRLIEKLMRKFHNGEIISSICGRFFGMDRGQNWDRTKAAYELITGTDKPYVSDNPIKAFTEAYNRGEGDENISPTRIENPNKKPHEIKDGDVVIFFNCRSERARQLIKPFIQKDFEKFGGFKRKVVFKKLHVVTFTGFAEALDHAHTAFPHAILEDTLPCALAAQNISQVYLAEREKYAHITYFFNGGVDSSRCGEARIRVPSKKVKTFASVPAMSTPVLAKKIMELIDQNAYDFYAVNFANADMLGHTGDMKATVKGIAVIDKALQQLYKKILPRGGTLMITADHGNAEQMMDAYGKMEMHHSSNPVPLFIIRKNLHNKRLRLQKGSLANIAPTILDLMHLTKPSDMTSSSVIKK